jgi:L-fuculose-phosphate aldolase
MSVSKTAKTKPSAAAGKSAGKPAAAAAAPILPDYVFRWETGKDPTTPAAIAKFFNSPAINALKVRMCDMGQRMWQREYTDGNGGNMTIRVGDNLFLTTQTLISKGFMTPETIALVDGDGRQLAGKFKRTSECLTHLAIYRAQPTARATCHAHPVHATAFAVAALQPPVGMIPEAEVFLGKIGLAPYYTPGTPELAEAVGDAAARGHNSILMVNHGVITWGDHIEDAYWKMENTEAYCKTIYIAKTLGAALGTINAAQMRDLMNLRKSLGMTDPRETLADAKLLDNSEFFSRFK